MMEKMTFIEDKLFKQLFKGYIKNQRKIGFTMGTGAGILIGVVGTMVVAVGMMISDEKLVLAEDKKEEAGE